MPRQLGKCREWEKERRDRLKEGFTILSKLLPNYDPSVNLSRNDILHKAVKYIEELQEQLKKLMANDDSVVEATANKIKSEEIKKCHERIRRLLCKNEQLCGLLRVAKITIPPGCALVKKFKSHLHWSNKITQEQAKILQKKEQEKENNEKKVKKVVSKSKTGGVGTPKHRKVIVNRNQKQLKTNRKKKVKSVVQPKCVIVLSQPSMTQPCYVITNAPSNGFLGNTSTVITNSNLLSSPLVSSNAKSYKPVTTVQSLGPGTLILANGTIVPVLPQPTVLPINSQIIPTPLPLNNKPQNPTVILVPKTPTTTAVNKTVAQTNKTTVTTTTVTTKTVPKLKPKACLTRTTQINKVPIPALTSRYGNNDLVLSKNEVKNVKSKTEKKTVESKTGENPTNKLSEIGEKRKLTSDNNLDEVKKLRTEPEGDKNEKRTEKNLEKDSNEDNSKKTVDSSENGKLVTENTVNKTIEAEIQPDPITKAKEIESVSENNVEKVAPEIIEETVVECPKALDISTEVKQSEEESSPHEMKALELNINHSELSNDIFASLQVPTGCQNPESTSPTAAFLLAFPLVSSLTGVKVTEVPEEENSESQRGTPTLLQIGTMDTTKPTQSESLTPSLLNLDNLSFFSSKDICGGFYNSFETTLSNSTTLVSSTPSVVSSTLPLESSTTTASAKNDILVTTNHVNEKTTNSTSNNTNNKLNFHTQQQQQSGDRQQQHQPTKTNLPDCNLENFSNRNHPVINESESTMLNYQIKQPKQSMKNLEQKQNCVNYNTHNQCNENFNDLAKISTTFSYSSVIKNYPDPLYTNSSTYAYNYSENNLNQSYYKNITKPDNRSYYTLNYENYNDYRKSETNSHFSGNYYNTQCSKDKFSNTNNNNHSNNSTTKVKSASGQIRPPINWMTTPDNRLQTDYVLPQFSKEGDFGHNAIYPPTNSFSSNAAQSYFNTGNTTYPNTNEIGNNQDIRKNLELPLVPPVNTYQRNDLEENQFSWSPTKIPQFLDPPPHTFVSSTLPTLVGDLALGNTLNFNSEQKNESNKNQKKDNRRIKYEHNQTNFLSVSQLVDHNKTENSVPARTTTRRNSGNRSSKKLQQQQQQQQKATHRSKTNETKDAQIYPSNSNNKIDNSNSKGLKQLNTGYNQSNTGNNSGASVQGGTSDIFCDTTKTNRNLPKQSSSNYSAEALIGHQLQPSDTISKNRQHNYTTSTTNKTLPVPSFLTENIISYFPSVDLPPSQDNNYIQQNQNYHQSTSFGHNFTTTFQNNTYTANTFIPPTTTSTYLPPTNNFMHDMAAGTTTSHDYSENLNLFPSTSQTKDKGCTNKNLNRVIGSSSRDQQNLCPVGSNTNVKKVKKKHTNETNLPGFVDFSFFSMPASINSPILPDDFHTHTGFLQPPTPQLYPCKNPLYSKQNDLASSSLLPLPPVPGTRSSIQHPEISPSINTAGTSLTNFNLSTIFPEINKGALSDPYLEPRIKDHTPRNYSSTAQGSFNEKPAFSFSYSTSQYNNQ